MNRLAIFYLIFSAAVLFTAGLPAIPDKPGATVKGHVECGGTGIEGVVVSDGCNVTKTDSEGRYWLKTRLSHADFVMISTPRGYDPPIYSNFLPKFFHHIDKTADTLSVRQFDFHLTKVDNDDYTLLVVADEHVSGRVIDIPPGSGNVIAKNDTLQFRDDFMPRLVAYADSLMQRTPVYGLNLGDMTHSEFWYRNNTGMPEYLRLAKDTPFMMYHVIGNHDHCHKYENDYESEAHYRQYFGPTYYSFNIGKVHYVVLDDMVKSGLGNKYERIISRKQIDWLRKDLDALDPEIRHLVVACHVPLVFMNGEWTDIIYNIRNSDELFPLLEGYEVTIMSGDWHVEWRTKVNERLIEYIHPAITGNWWYRQGVSNNGIPAAFVEYVFRGGRIESRDLIDWSRNNDKQQFRVYNKGVTSNTGMANKASLDPAGGAPSVMVVFWSIAPDWTFICRENGKTTSGGNQLARRYDLLARSINEEGVIPSDRYEWLIQKPVWTFIYTPQDLSAEIEIIATDPHFNREIRVVTRIEK